MTAFEGPLMDRRAFLTGVVATAIAAGCSGGDDSDDAGPEGSANGEAAAADLPPLPADLPASLFALGVASGDPLPDSVILWTRLVADLGAPCPDVADPARTMLGEEQEAWLGDALARSDATWNVLAQQVVMTRLALIPGTDDLFNLDQWDGYPASRQREIDLLRGVSNPVVITGDIHLSGLGVVTREGTDPPTEPVATELVGTSISSSFPAAFVDAIGAIASASPAVHYAEARHRGYVVVEVTPDELRADYRYVSTTAEPTAELSTGASWRVRAGNPVPQPA